jgi:putative serine protease PepD
VGTGLILDQEGHILTNNHVVAGDQRIIVTLSNGDSFEAELVGCEAATDTAVIRQEMTTEVVLVERPPPT